MVFCVYVNPTIDKTIYVGKLCVGGTNRPDKIVVDGAGKAINAALVMNVLAIKVKVIGLSYEQDSNIIVKRLNDQHVDYDFLRIPGASRINTKIFDRTTRRITEINETGLAVDMNVLDSIAGKVFSEAQEGDVVLLTGSLPPGCPAKYYADIIREMRKKNVRCVLDAAGEPLRLGVDATPYMIKPNIDELQELTGKQIRGMADIRSACMQMHQSGVALIAVSMGSKGAILSDGNKMVFAAPLKLDVLSTVGAGDSMVAGMIAELDHNGNLESILRSGAAAASGSITLEGTKLCDEELYERNLMKIDITTI